MKRSENPEKILKGKSSDILFEVDLKQSKWQSNWQEQPSSLYTRDYVGHFTLNTSRVVFINLKRYYFKLFLFVFREQMRRSPIYDLCLAIQFIPQEFANLQVTREEFLCMKAIILLNTGGTLKLNTVTTQCCKQKSEALMTNYTAAKQ